MVKMHALPKNGFTNNLCKKIEKKKKYVKYLRKNGFTKNLYEKIYIFTHVKLVLRSVYIKIKSFAWKWFNKQFM